MMTVMSSIGLGKIEQDVDPGVVQFDIWAAMFPKRFRPEGLEAAFHCHAAAFEVGFHTWYGRLPSTQMAGLAPSYGLGFHGDALHARRENTCHSVETYPLLSCSDIEELLRHFLPKRAVIKEEVIAQMEKRHKKRLAYTMKAYRKQWITLLE
jgi:hypothetical protein